VQWNSQSFAKLVLPNNDLIEKIVKSHTNDKNAYSADIIQGKGKALIVLLHGEPGVGKTSTAGKLSKLLVFSALTIA